jgi:hypothetical protein
MTREWKLFVQDILNAIIHVQEFVGHMSFEEFMADEKTRSAVVFKIENIGEASKNIPRAAKLKYKEIPWADMAGMRNKIAHFYFGIDYEIVWRVVKDDLRLLEPSIRKMLSDITPH